MSPDIAALISVLTFCCVGFEDGAPIERVRAGLAYSEKCARELRKCIKKKSADDCMRGYPIFQPEQLIHIKKVKSK